MSASPQVITLHNLGKNGLAFRPHSLAVSVAAKGEYGHLLPLRREDLAPAGGDLGGLVCHLSDSCRMYSGREVDE